MVDRGNRFKLLVHYVCDRRCSTPDTLGAVKLNKILWLSDLTAFYETGSAITNSRYIKQEFGPVPARIMPVLHELEAERVLSIRESPYFGKRKKEYVVHKPSSRDFLSEDEFRIVDDIIDHVCDDHTAASVSAISHDHIWMAAEDGEEIPLFTVFAKPGRITDVERQWAQIQLESATS